MTKTEAYQAFEKLPRPLLRWAALLAFLWVCGGCDIAGIPMDSATRGLILGSIALIYGLRGWEKVKEMTL